MKVIEFRQNNMYCNVCFSHALEAISGISGVRELDVDMRSKKIRLLVDNSSMGRRKIQECVNRAITGGYPSMLTRHTAET
ncbi:hypothetical protein FACS1894184_04560 [Clostridia bacterium]|nr:hypothetical protein FACS1894184_04560 [Clostridia bacterium]